MRLNTVDLENKIPPLNPTLNLSYRINSVPKLVPFNRIHNFKYAIYIEFINKHVFCHCWRFIVILPNDIGRVRYTYITSGKMHSFVNVSITIFY